MSYDRKCYNLAAVFLSDHPTIDNDANCDALAQIIAHAIDDFLDEKIDADEKARAMALPDGVTVITLDSDDPDKLRKLHNTLAGIFGEDKI
ncbi:MAG TPA: hypothetical protein VHT52_17780 [Stellaceae bacterium]|jgi:hypothetical protein|nr:hypothetical protein [Stellaceae bacterium]